MAKVVRAEASSYIDEIGSCSALETVSVRPQVSGQITEVHFVDGAELKKGDRLFTIDPRPFQAALSQAKASLAQNQASLNLAQLDFERAEKLFPLKAISKEDYETRRNAVEVGQAQVLASEAAIQTAALNLDYCYICSPTEGRAGKNLVDVGNVVQTSANPVLLVINRLSPIYVDFTITEGELPAVRRELAKGTLKTRVWLSGDGVQESRAAQLVPRGPTTAATQATTQAAASGREGNLTFIDNTVQSSTGTVALRATLENADRHFWPGQFVQVRLVLSTQSDAVLIPSQATQISQAGSFVCIVKEDATAEFRPVKLGQAQGDMVVVTEGLTGGEQVVTSGLLGVVPGQKVQVQQSPMSAAAPGATAAALSSRAKSTEATP